MGYALVTCLDSCFDLPLMMERSKSLQRLRGKGRRIGRGLMLTTRQLVAAERRQRLFHGFDEVWFFPKRDIRAKPDTLILVGPHRVQPAAIADHAAWLQASGCSLGLGDGDGLNYCARLRGVSPVVVELINESLQGLAARSA
jgi:hypothetical protein